jgi:hypothetical protein
MQNQWFITKVRGKPLERVPVKLDATFSEVVPSFRPVLDSVHKPACLELVQFQFQFNKTCHA